MKLKIKKKTGSNSKKISFFWKVNYRLKWNFTWIISVFHGLSTSIIQCLTLLPWLHHRDTIIKLCAQERWVFHYTDKVVCITQQPNLSKTNANADSNYNSNTKSEWIWVSCQNSQGHKPKYMPCDCTALQSMGGIADGGNVQIVSSTVIITFLKTLVQNDIMQLCLLIFKVVAHTGVHLTAWSWDKLIPALLWEIRNVRLRRKKSSMTLQQLFVYLYRIWFLIQLILKPTNM